VCGYCIVYSHSYSLFSLLLLSGVLHIRISQTDYTCIKGDVTITTWNLKLETSSSPRDTVCIQNRVCGSSWHGKKCQGTQLYMRLVINNNNRVRSTSTHTCYSLKECNDAGMRSRIPRLVIIRKRNTRSGQNSKNSTVYGTKPKKRLKKKGQRVVGLVCVEIVVLQRGMRRARAPPIQHSTTSSTTRSSCRSRAWSKQVALLLSSPESLQLHEN